MVDSEGGQGVSVNLSVSKLQYAPQNMLTFTFNIYFNFSLLLIHGSPILEHVLQNSHLCPIICLTVLSFSSFY
jgi:hypothetical protein